MSLPQNIPGGSGYLKDPKQIILNRKKVLHEYEEEILLIRQRILQQNEIIQELKKAETQHRKDHGGVYGSELERKRLQKQIEILEKTLLRAQNQLSNSRQEGLQLRRRITDLEQTLHMLQTDYDTSQAVFQQLEQSASELRSSVRHEKAAKNVAVAEINSLVARFTREKDLWKSELRNLRTSMPQKGPSLIGSEFSTQIEKTIGSRLPRNAKGVVGSTTMKLPFRKVLGAPDAAAGATKPLKLKKLVSGRKDAATARRADTNHIPELLKYIAAQADVNPGLLSFVEQFTTEHLELRKKLTQFNETVERLQSQTTGDLSEGRRVVQKLEKKLRKKKERHRTLIEQSRELTHSAILGFNGAVRVLSLLGSCAVNAEERTLTVGANPGGMAQAGALRALPVANDPKRGPAGERFRLALSTLEEKVERLVEQTAGLEDTDHLFPAQFFRSDEIREKLFPLEVPPEVLHGDNHESDAKSPDERIYIFD
eukprot:gnl/Chilomastix_cuspidata/712.p1 GENE.gnl/Chilomastix_cuspidata/712~~gnl/Chilomastix_cuspidata/712.p1  ORF type:complete len:483 (+),score=256.74 gnl/Chilomastix_cuspidata/712:61-1509(+)